MGFWETIKGFIGLEPPPSPEELAHLNAIAAAPDDLELRLAYAHHLEARQHPLGEFIRSAIELDRLPADEPRRQELQSRCDALLEKHGRRWVRPLKELDLEPMMLGIYAPSLWFHRGMIEQVTIDKRAIVPGKMQRLLELAPALRKLTFERCSPDWSAISTSPSMSRIKALDIADVKWSLLELQALLASPHLKQLEELDIGNKDYGADLVQALAKSTQVKELRTLGLASCRLGPAGAAVLANEPRFTTLEKLNLAYNQLQDEGAIALGQSTTLTQLSSLNINSNDLNSTGVQALSRGPYIRLQELELESAELDVAAMQSLANSPFAATLTTLNLGWNRAGDAAIAALLLPGSFAHLHTLKINGSNLTAKGLRQVLDSDSLANVVEFDLSSNELGSEGIAALVTAPKLKKVQTVLLYSVELSAEDRRKLQQRFGQEGLRC